MPFGEFAVSPKLVCTPGVLESREPIPGGTISMHPRLWIVAVAVLFVPGCSNTLNPFCGSARPAPLIGSLSPSTVAFSQVQQGAILTVNGSQFVSASEVEINGTALSTTVVSPTQL